jgi:cytochrome c peroxidase
VDKGIGAISGRPQDEGLFKVPSLRNIELTAPYMHDGRFATLEEVIAHYDHGVQRAAALDPNLAKHPAAGLGLSAEDQRALVAFLRSLTDER